MSEMDLEEDVVFEHSPLYKFMVENSMKDFETSSRNISGCSTFVPEYGKFNLNNIDTAVHEYLTIILQSELLLKEDYDMLEFVFSSTYFQATTNSVPTGLYLILAFPAIVLSRFKEISLYYMVATLTPPTAYCLYKLYTFWVSKKHLKNLIIQIKIMSNKVRSLVKILYDYDVLLISSRRDNELSSSNKKLECMRTIVSNLMVDIINMFINGTKNICLKIDVNLQKYTLNDKVDEKSSSISILYNLLLLAQSEFLLHVGYVFCKPLSIQGQQEHKIMFDIIVDILQELVVYVDKLEHALNSFLNLTPLYNEHKADTISNSFKEVHSGLRNTCIILHHMLLHSSDILKSFEDVKVEEETILQQAYETFEILNADIKKLSSYFYIFEINLKRTLSCSQSNHYINLVSNNSQEIVKLNHLHFDDKEVDQDEVFETYVGSENDQIVGECTFEEDSLTKTQLEAYKLLLYELQPILKDRKKNWEIREAKARQIYLGDKSYIKNNLDTISTKAVPEFSEEDDRLSQNSESSLMETPNVSHIIRQDQKQMRQGIRVPLKCSKYVKNKQLDDLLQQELASILVKQRSATCSQEDCISFGDDSNE